ncbi:MAG: iron ABC transporter permease [Selenomonas sp.]|uniref:FecCD family ABC transporter permease n=1 Tax=Selenomonas sp. TaxID=2053611 RepID=UPI0025E9A591|nr:iron ABC transporter permease [Selenomonas sp.]MCR5757536.1 iron ABC transporter permease [Selenomonas sp.]
MRRYGIIVLVLGICLAVAGILSLSWGQMKIPFFHVVAGLAQGMELPFLTQVPVPADEMAVIWHIRLPRTIVGLLTGVGLGISGAVLQGIFANQLADPGIIGVSSGASVGAVLAIATGAAGVTMFALPVGALVGALAAVGLTVAMAWRHGRIPVMTLLLSGVVVGMFLAAFSAAVLTLLDVNKLQEYLFWTIGGLDYRRWEHVLLGLGPILVSSTVLLILARQLNVLVLGDNEAKAVGMAVKRYRLLLLVLASMATATSVCISGNIGFVGLVVPHMMRLIVGPDHRQLLPASLLAGAAFLVLCDAVGRVILPGYEIRVGIMTAFIGTPYFLYLLRKYQQKLD